MGKFQGERIGKNTTVTKWEMLIGLLLLIKWQGVDEISLVVMSLMRNQR